MSEKSGWYCESLDDRGSSERCHTRSEAEKALEGSVLCELRLGGILYPTPRNFRDKAIKIGPNSLVGANQPIPDSDSTSVE